MHSELRIAMWSGPRNISTALMRSFENRSDSFVTDEPFYAYFLKESGEDHPGRQEIIQSQSSDWVTVASELIGSIPQGKTIWYQKHMAHHILDYSNLDWINSVFNCFLIRDPKEVICSYVKRFKLIDHKQLGFNQQLRIFKKIKSLKPGKGKEIHITDAIQLLIDDKEKFVAHNFEGKYLDCGTMNGYINSSKEIGKI